LNESEETILVRRCQTGDEEAFRELIERYSRVLFGTAYLITRDRGLAEDAVQTTLIQVWKSLPKTSLHSSFKAWLVRIVVNEVKKQYRKKRVQTISLEQISEVSGDPDEVETTIMHKEERQNLKLAVQLLPIEQREAVVLRYFSELTVPEVAAILREREGTIKSRLSRAISRLGEILKSDKAYERRT
jgi:RNA polymerase sigma-70 factor (ECF subfamily)